MPTSNNPISKSEIIARFGVVVRDYLVANTNWNASTIIVPGYSVGYITGGIAHASSDPGIPSTAQVADLVEADVSQVGALTKVLRDFMIFYARNQRVYLNNTGNYGGSTSGVVRLNTSNGLDASMSSQITNAINSRAVTGNSLVDASNLENFLIDCRNIWASLCATNNIKTYNFNYCHTNHTNYPQHGSRGRR